MTYETLLYNVRAEIAYVTIHRPQKLNALNRRAVEELMICFGEIGKAEGLRAAILTGAGDKAFAAGADIGELATLTPTLAQETSLRGQQLMNLIENLGKPVIAAVNGLALGAGCELAMASTLRIASENAQFGQPEVKLGLIPGYAGTQRLPRFIGKGRALQMILGGESISAQEAWRIGLANQVVSPSELIAAAEATARKIAAHAPLAIKYALESVNCGMELPSQQGELLEAGLFGLCCATLDMKEGTAAFLEKRPAKFTGQ
ncbi:MAG: enoyl-CoA hydratase-related protein [Acidobacteria bacterium]|nr:enoyl-CoA hydratase-related protein [Acidobacteriota bacterium]